MITVTADTFPLAQTFTISRGSKTHAHVLTVRVSRGGVTGWAECVPYPRYGDTLERVVAQISALPEGITREAVQTALPAGSARNAVDCALWDLAAKTSGRPVWQLAGLAAPKPVKYAFAWALRLLPSITNSPFAEKPQRSIKAVTRALRVSSSNGLNLLNKGAMNVG